MTNLSVVSSWPSGKLPFDCQKIAKNLTFFSKNFTKIVIFSTKLPMAILWKKYNFWELFWKNVKILAIFFDIQMAIFRRVSWGLTLYRTRVVPNKTNLDLFKISCQYVCVARTLHITSKCSHYCTKHLRTMQLHHFSEQINK